MFAILTLLGSYSPRSFTSTLIHGQHLHRLTLFALDLINDSYLTAWQVANGRLSVDAVENDTQEKIRIALLLKTVLCTNAANVMLYIPSWNQMVAQVEHLAVILHHVSPS